jgi:hypothetical protein
LRTHAVRATNDSEREAAESALIATRLLQPLESAPGAAAVAQPPERGAQFPLLDAVAVVDVVALALDAAEPVELLLLELAGADCVGAAVWVCA